MPPEADVVVRALREGDRPRLQAWRCDPETQRLLMWRAGTPTAAELDGWLARRSSDEDGWFGVVARGELAIGFVQLMRINRADRYGYLGLFIAAEERGRGGGARAVAHAEGEARARGLEKLVIEVLAANQAALRFWSGRGFRHVGVLRGHHRDAGEAHDVVLMEKRLAGEARAVDPEPAPLPTANDPAVVQAMGADAEVASLRRRLFELMGKYRYAYNWTWYGRPIIQLPQDVLAMQALILAERPDLIIETGVAHGGQLVFFASMLELLGGAGRAVGVDIDIRPHNRRAIEAHPLAHRIALIQGSSVDEGVAAAVRAHARGARRVMVCLDSNHTAEHVARELALYAPLVSVGQHLVVFDTAIEEMPASAFPDRPWAPGNSPMTAVRAFLASNPGFVVDHALEARLLFTVAPEGYLKRVA